MAYRLRYEIISISCGFCLYLTTSPWAWAHTVAVLKLMSVHWVAQGLLRSIFVPFILAMISEGGSQG